MNTTKEIRDSIIIQISNALKNHSIQADIIKSLYSDKKIDNITTLTLMVSNDSIAINTMSGMFATLGLLGDSVAMSIFKDYVRFTNLMKNAKAFSEIGLASEVDTEKIEERKMAILQTMMEYSAVNMLNEQEFSQHPIVKLAREITP